MYLSRDDAKFWSPAGSASPTEATWVGRAWDFAKYFAWSSQSVTLDFPYCRMLSRAGSYCLNGLEGCQKKGEVWAFTIPPRPRNPRMVFFPEKMLPTFFLSEIRPLMGEQNIHLVPIQKILFFDPGILFPRIRARQGFFQSCPNGCRHDKGTPESRPSVKHVWGCRFL